MRRIVFGLILQLMFSAAAKADSDAMTIHILARAKGRTVKIESNRPMRVRVGGKEFKATLCRISLAVNDAIEVRCDGKPAVRGSAEFTPNDGLLRVTAEKISRRYRGGISISVASGKMRIVNRIPLEQYLYSVVAAESPDGGLEALRAQAVTSRTVAWEARGRHGDGYDFCDLSDCQDYPGAGAERPDAVRAVNDTAGQVLYCGGRVMRAYYHSTCGGRTATTAMIWGGRSHDACLASVDDRPFCADSLHAAWRRELRPGDIQRIDRSVFKKKIFDIQTLGASSDKSIPPSKVRVTFESGHKDYSAEEFHAVVGRAIGWGVVKSPFYRISRGPSGYVVEGRGLGHGVGLCQRGAMGMAGKGWNYRKILAFYFPGAKIQSMSEKDNASNK